MDFINHFIVPGIIGGIFLFGVARGVNTFDAFREGLSTAVSITPALICLLTAVAMFKASGALDVLSWGLSPLAQAVGLPGEVIPLALLRPISGSGAMVLFNDLLAVYGPDGGGDAGLHRDHLLHHRGVLRGHPRHPDPAHPALRPFR